MPEERVREKGSSRGSGVTVTPSPLRGIAWFGNQPVASDGRPIHDVTVDWDRFVPPARIVQGVIVNGGGAAIQWLTGRQRLAHQAIHTAST